MSSEVKLEEPKQLSLQISHLTQLNNYEKIRILGSGGFAKVYLVRQRKDQNANKTTHFPDSTSKPKITNEGNEFAAKMQGFNGGPVLNRREASILKRLVNPEVS